MVFHLLPLSFDGGGGMLGPPPRTRMNIRSSALGPYPAAPEEVAAGWRQKQEYADHIRGKAW